MYIIRPLDVNFDIYTDVKDCFIKIIEVKQEISYRLQEGIREFESLPECKAYRNYYQNIIGALLLYGVIGVLTFFAYLFNGNLDGMGYLLFGVIGVSVYLLWGLSNYLPLKEWYKKQKPAIIHLYYDEWIKSLKKYRDWCISHNEITFGKISIPKVDKDIEDVYDKQFGYKI